MKPAAKTPPVCVPEVQTVADSSMLASPCTGSSSCSSRCFGCLCLCYLEGLQLSAPSPLSCDKQEGSGIPASDHSPKVIISDTQHTLASGLSVLMDVFLGKAGLRSVMGESE